MAHKIRVDCVHPQPQQHAPNVSTDTTVVRPLASSRPSADGRALRNWHASHPETPAGRASIGSDFELCTATEEDHGAIHDFLQSVFQGPSEAEFRHALQAPRYEPLDRLMFRRHGEIIAHVQLRHHTLQFGDLTIPAIDVRHLGTLPEYRGIGLARRLLRAVENDTNLHGALVATARATNADFFCDQGWSPWLSHCQSTASPRALVSQLDLQAPKPETPWSRQTPRPLAIRHWRRNELSALRRLYALGQASRFGGLARDESDWQWLISGNGYDYIYVALENPHDRPLEELTDKDICGYAVLHEGRIIELEADPESDAARQLLSRVGHDAMEMGRHSVVLDASPDSPLHLAFLAAGGRCHRQHREQQGVLLAKLLQPDALLQRMRPLLFSRYRSSDAELPDKLGVKIGLRQFTLQFGRRQVALVEGELASHHITIEAAAFSCMLLGQYRIQRLIDAGQVLPSDRDASRLADALFPRRATWRMPWEDLPARTVR